MAVAYDPEKTKGEKVISEAGSFSEILDLLKY